jgi:hypothetical protein
MERIGEDSQRMRLGLTITRRWMIIGIGVIRWKDILRAGDATLESDAGGSDEKKTTRCNHRKPFESAL